MKEIMLAGSYWLHLIATVVWLGGIAFVLFVAIPSAKQVLGVEASKVIGEISKRFTPLANYSILLLIVTGIVLAAVNKQFSGIGNFDNSWSLALIVKHVFVFGMVAVHFYRGFALAPRIARTELASAKASLQKLSLNLVKVNFCLGLMVLLLSGIISILK
jgi:uncharacterized membrane protein